MNKPVWTFPKSEKFEVVTTFEGHKVVIMRYCPYYLKSNRNSIQLFSVSKECYQYLLAQGYELSHM